MIWVKVKKISDDYDSIYLPRKLIDKIDYKVKLQFGLRKVEVYSFPLPVPEENENNSFYTPVTMECSESVADKLLLREDIVYQMTYREGVLNIGPLIGLLLGGQQFYYHNSNMGGITRIMRIYPRIGGLFVSFKDESIDWLRGEIRGLYFDYESKQWKYGVFPIPSVIFRRAFQTNQAVIDRLKKLTHNKVFNSIRIDKWDMYKLLEKNRSFKKYLPETLELNEIEFFHDFIHMYNNIIVKPKGLSRGRGICFIHKIDNQYAVYDYRLSDTPQFYALKESEINSYLINNSFINSDYVIQPQLNLATINGAPFDIRVVMGKNEDGIWHCEGIECRLAGPKNIITNISRGGQALSISNAIRLSLGPTVDSNGIRNKIISIAEEFCSIMDKTDGHFAEFGLDLAIDSEQNYWFIEANVRPAFKGFRMLDYRNYLHIVWSPLLYAASLAGFGKEVKKHEPKI